MLSYRNYFEVIAFRVPDRLDKGGGFRFRRHFVGYALPRDAVDDDVSADWSDHFHWTFSVVWEYPSIIRARPMPLARKPHA